MCGLSSQFTALELRLGSWRCLQVCEVVSVACLVAWGFSAFSECCKQESAAADLSQGLFIQQATSLPESLDEVWRPTAAQHVEDVVRPFLQ